MNYLIEKGINGRLEEIYGIEDPYPKLYNFFYTIMTPFYPLMKLIPYNTTSTKLGLAMINCFYYPSNDKYLNNKKINTLSAKHMNK